MLTLLNLEQPEMRADYESNAPTGASVKDIASMEQFLIGVKSHSGVIVTPERAKRCSAVLACMRGISEDIASLPINVFKRGPNGDEIVQDHILHRILNIAPNDVMTPIEVREHMIIDMMTSGNFYNLKIEDPDSPGDVIGVWPLPAPYVVRQWRELYWTYTDPTTGDSGAFIPDDVWRGTIMSPNGLDGVALTLLAREAIGLLLAAEEQAARLFNQGIQTDLVLSTDDVVEDKDQLRKALMEKHSGFGNAWMPMLLENGLKANRIGLTAQESQYLEARGFQVGDVARIFRYPEVLLGSAGKTSKASTYASAEQFFQSYTKHTLGPWAARIEQTIHRDMLTTKEQAKMFVKHDFDGLLRADTAARYASYVSGIAAGFLSPADARKKENLPFVPGLDYYTRPLNTAATAGGDAGAVKPTDQSGSARPRKIRATAPVELYFPNNPPDASGITRNDVKVVAGLVNLAHNVAALILKKERTALIGQKQEADAFYARFGGFVEDLTGAPATAVTGYLEGRRTTAERFTTEAQDAAIAALIQLCQQEK